MNPLLGLTMMGRWQGRCGPMNQTMQTGMQPGREPSRWAPPRRPAAGPLPELVSRSLAMRRVCEQLQQVGPRVRLALIEGEAGTGKHLLARHIQARHAAPGIMVAEEASAVFCAEATPHSELRPEPLRAAAEERLVNPRSRSAKLRWAVR